MLPDWKETRASAALGSSLFFFAMLERGFLVGTPGYDHVSWPSRQLQQSRPPQRLSLSQPGTYTLNFTSSLLAHLVKFVLIPGCRSTYLTLPTPLTDADYDKFLVAFDDFLMEMKEPLALLSKQEEETLAAALPDNERRLSRASL